MPDDIRRRKNESFEAFMRRVKRQWQQSGKILQAKKIQYFDPPKSKNVRRKSAIARVRKAEEWEYLRKIGKLPLDQQGPMGSKSFKR